MTLSTKAAVLRKIGSPLDIVSLEIPELQEGQVLVKVHYAGLCHSQLNEILGKKGEDKYLPHVLGHEGSGVVIKCGENVREVTEGDHVVMSWINSDGINAPGPIYKDSIGAVNSGPISTFLEKAIISENKLVKIPKNLPLKEAALLGCAIPTGGGIVLNVLKPKISDYICVIGVGGVGLSAVMVAKSLGINNILVLDVHDKKIDTALSLGASAGFNVLSGNPIEFINNQTDNIGVDFCIESAGKRDSMELAFAITKQKGKCVLAGNLPKGDLISIDPMDLIQGKKLIGSAGGDSILSKDIPLYTKWFQEDRLELNRMITNVYSLDEINIAFEELLQGKVARNLISFR